MAAAAAAYEGLATGNIPRSVTVTLPRGQEPVFQVHRSELRHQCAMASVVKDAGDDPDVTNGAEVVVQISYGDDGTGVQFRAGEGVGIVTKQGLPVEPGEPAINPGPRRMIESAIEELADRFAHRHDLQITIGVVDGEQLAQQTWNPRLGIVGGLSILGTTGIVVPYSCSAWIASIHQGIDVARAEGLSHIAGSTGRTSEQVIRAYHDLSDGALIDMGDFVGGMLKYLRRHPVERVTIAGGIGKMTKLAQGALDLHSSRSQVDQSRLATFARDAGASREVESRIRHETSASAALAIASAAMVPLGERVAAGARETAIATLSGSTEIDVVVINRAGDIIGVAGP